MHPGSSFFRPLVLAVVCLLLSSCATRHDPATTPAPEPPFGAAKVTLSPGPLVIPAPEKVPHLSFAGVHQERPVTPLWSVKIAPEYHPAGDPLVSPDGRWLVIAQGSYIILFDLEARAVVTRQKLPGILVQLFFDRSGSGLIGLFNSTERPHDFFSEGYPTLGFWKLPSLEFSSRPLAPDYVPATNAALTHAGDRMLVFGIDRSIGVFDVATGRRQFRFDGHMGEKPGRYVTHLLGGLGVSHDDLTVTSYTGGPHPNGRLRRWSLADGREIPTGPEGYDYDRNGGHLMTYTADDRFVLKTGGNWGLVLNKAGDGHGEYFYNTWGYRHYDSRFPHVAIADGNAGCFGVIDVRSGQLLFAAAHEVEPPAEYPTTQWAILSADNRTLYTANYGHILAWAWADRPTDQLLAGTSWTYLLARNGSRLQTFERSPGPQIFSRVIEWNLDSRTFAASGRSMPYSFAEETDARGNTVRWTSGAFSLDGRIVTISGAARLAKFVEPVAGRTLFEVGTPGATPDPAMPPDIPDVFSNNPLAAAAAPGGRFLVLGSVTGRPLTLWDLPAGRYTATIEGHSHGVTSVQYSPDGRRLISGDANGKVLVRPAPAPAPAASQPAPVPADAAAPPPSAWIELPHGAAPGRVRHTCSNADGTLVAIVHGIGDTYSTGSYGFVDVWQDTRQGEWRQLFTCQLPRFPDHAALSPDGRLLAVSQLDFGGKARPNGDRFGEVFVLDARTGELRCVLDWVDARDLMFLDDHRLATAGNGTQIWTLPGSVRQPE